jgi:hypothetical protein
MGLIRLRYPLVYPGTLAAVNAAHPMALGARYAGVAAPGGAFINLFTGKPSVPTNGTLTTGVFGSLGPTVNSVGSTVYNAIANPYADSPSAITFAAILSPIAASGGGANVIFSTNPATTVNSAGLKLGPALDLEIFTGNNAYASGLPATLSGNKPAFIAASFQNGKQNWVYADLPTGRVFAITTTAALSVTAGTSTWGVGYSGIASLQPNSNIAAVAYSANFLSLQQLIQWAQAPWDFWYAPTLGSLLTSVRTFSAVQHNQTVSPSTVSTFTVAKKAGKTDTISTTSALSAIKSVAHKLAISTTSALSAARSFISGIPTAYTQTVTITTSSALTAIKRVSKMIWGFAFRVTQDGSFRLTQDGNQRVVEAAGFSSTSSLTLSKVAAIGRTVAISTTSALSLAKAVTHKLAISTSSTVTALRKIFASVHITITTSSAVTVAKSVTKGATAFVSSILVSDGSAVTVTKAVGKRVAISTSSALTALKAVSKALAISTTSAVARAATKAKTVVITVTTSSAVTLRKAATKAVAIQTSSALAFAKAFGRVVTISSIGTLAITKAVAKKIAITTSSAVQLTLGYVYTVLVAIATSTASTVVVSWTLTRVCLVLISTISSVLVNAIRFGLAVGREAINLVGLWAHMLLYGQVSQLVLAGQMSHMELGMSTNVNGVFHAGETWIINGLARDINGVPLNLSGATVQLRIVNGSAIVLDLATPTGGVVVTPTAGTYQFLITPTQQFAANMTLTAYEYEARVELGDGTISVQNTGEITVKPSRFVG